MFLRNVFIKEIGIDVELTQYHFSLLFVNKFINIPAYSIKIEQVLVMFIIFLLFS